MARSPDIRAALTAAPTSLVQGCTPIDIRIQKRAELGASVNTYVTPQGHLGSAQFHFKVAHKPGDPCPGCGRPITRVPVRGRGAYFCPSCQPLTS